VGEFVLDVAQGVGSGCSVESVDGESGCSVCSVDVRSGCSVDVEAVSRLSGREESLADAGVGMAT
jgi:hypothetical protein